MFAYINGYSGQSIYDDYFITFYNLFFTALPLGARAVWDQDLNPVTDGAAIKLFLPKLYYVGQKSTIFNWTNYFIWVFGGCAHAVVVFVLPYYIFQRTIWEQSGTTADMWIWSVTSFTSLFCVILLILTLLIDRNTEALSKLQVLLYYEHSDHNLPLHMRVLRLHMACRCHDFLPYILDYGRNVVIPYILLHCPPLYRPLLRGGRFLHRV